MLFVFLNILTAASLNQWRRARQRAACTMWCKHPRTHRKKKRVISCSAFDIQDGFQTFKCTFGVLVKLGTYVSCVSRNSHSTICSLKHIWGGLNHLSHPSHVQPADRVTPHLPHWARIKPSYTISGYVWLGKCWTKSSIQLDRSSNPPNLAEINLMLVIFQMFAIKYRQDHLKVWLKWNRACQSLQEPQGTNDVILNQ